MNRCDIKNHQRRCIKGITIVLWFILIHPSYGETGGGTIHGTYDSILDIKHTPDFGSDIVNWGINNYSNLRYIYKNDNFTFGMYLNIFLNAGSYTDLYKLVYTQETVAEEAIILSAPSSYYSMPFYYKNTFIGAFELDRFYFKTGGELFDIEAGLIRLAHGFGYSFSPTDFFNTRNPFNPEARKEGRLAINSVFYPMDLWKIETFVVAPDNPLEQAIWGTKWGVSTLFNVNKFDIEILYTLLFPEISYKTNPVVKGLPDYTNNDFSHIVGFSLKGDLEIGLILDMIYRLDQKVIDEGSYYGKEFHGWEGLQASLGIDYTFDKVYLLAEYMFYGSGMIDWNTSSLGEVYSGDWQNTAPFYRAYQPSKKPQSYLRHDYLSILTRIKVNDYLRLGLNTLMGLDDQSAIVSLFGEIEAFDSFLITIRALYPLDKKFLGLSDQPGEFGPINIGYFQDYQIAVQLKY